MKLADRQIIQKLNEIYDAQAAGGAASFASLTGSPSDNAALDSALDAKAPLPDDTAYGAGWDGSTAAPTQDKVYDKIEAVVASIPTGGIVGTISGTIDHNLSMISGVVVTGICSAAANTGGAEGVARVDFTSSQPDTNYRTLNTSFSATHTLLGQVDPASKDVDGFTIILADVAGGARDGYFEVIIIR